MKIYTDGSGNSKGFGGWAFVVVVDDKIVETCNGLLQGATNNMCEIYAVLQAFYHAPDDREVTVITDSKYVQQGLTEWCNSWELANWVKSNGEPVKNCNYWKQLLEISRKKRNVKCIWQKGHNGCVYNNHADWLSKKR